jgi:hypothetical protein
VVIVDELGLSFSPFSGNNNGATRDQNGGVSPQEAIRILSLRVPRTVGAAAPIPSALMNAPGGASLGGGQPSPGLSGMNLEMLLRHLFGQPSGQPSMPGGPGMPSGMPSMPGMMAPSGPPIRNADQRAAAGRATGFRSGQSTADRRGAGNAATADDAVVRAGTAIA